MLRKCMKCLLLFTLLRSNVCKKTKSQHVGSMLLNFLAILQIASQKEKEREIIYEYSTKKRRREERGTKMQCSSASCGYGVARRTMHS